MTFDKYITLKSGDDKYVYVSSNEDHLIVNADPGSDTLNGNDEVTISGHSMEINGDGVKSGAGGNDIITFDAKIAATVYGERDLHPFEFGNDTLINLSPSGATVTMYGDSEDGTSFMPLIGGDDRLVSGASSDLMYGDPLQTSDGYVSGADTFVFLDGSGRDIIFDFEQGKDTIEVGRTIDGGFSSPRHSDPVKLNQKLENFQNKHAAKVAGLEEKYGAVDDADLDDKLSFKIAKAETKLTKKLEAYAPPYGFEDLNFLPEEDGMRVQFDEFDSVLVVGVSELTVADFNFV